MVVLIGVTMWSFIACIACIMALDIWRGR